MSDKASIKSRIKTLKAILYIVILLWLIILIYTIYDFIANDINPMLVLALVILVSSMTIISQLKKFQNKKLADLENSNDEV